jgi:hypothetical protein
MTGVQESPAFAWTCRELEVSAGLSTLVARGTVRLALRQAGLQPQAVSGEQMAIVLRELLPQELANRAVADSERVCRRLADRIQSQRFEGSDAAVDVFRRLGGGK